jgi:hypothetical protein
MRRGRCKYCEREIVWVRVEGGNWRAFEKIREVYTMQVILADWAPVLMDASDEIFQPHAAVCPRSREGNEPPERPVIDNSRFGG